MSVNCVRAKFVTSKLANTRAHTHTPNMNGHKDCERLLVKKLSVTLSLSLQQFSIVSNT